jgi:hypothetical protein
MSPSGLHRALEFLMRAHDFAQAAGSSVRDAAVEIEILRAAGVTDLDVHWLLCRQYIDYAGEGPSLQESPALFEHPGARSFDPGTCFVLTEIGVALVRRTLPRPVRSVVAPIPMLEPPPLPRYDAGLRELRVGSVVVKQFRQPAESQETILEAFEEEGWPPCIDDPLPPIHHQDPRRRLHDAVSNLNRNQRRQLLKFMMWGNGRAVRWKFLSDCHTPETPKLL